MNSIPIPNHFGSMMSWGGAAMAPFLGSRRPSLDQYDLLRDLDLPEDDEIDMTWVEGDDETGRP